MIAITQLQQIRNIYPRLISDLSDEQLTKIPDGFKNNILWNMAHVVATQQLLHYGLSNLQMKADQSLIDENRKATSPSDWTKTPDKNEVLRLLNEHPIQLEEDYKNGLFQEFNTYKTSAGFTLHNIDEAITFNNFHEGLHIGVIMAQRKLLI